MYCSKCGAPNDDDRRTCGICGAKLMSAMLDENDLGELELDDTYSAPADETVPNYLVQSILVTFFCCLPFGIPAIVYASQVDGKLAGGDVAGAREASNNAKMWCWISFGIGAAFVVIYLVIAFAAAIAGVGFFPPGP